MSNVSPERFWYVVVSHGGIILLWQKLSLDEIHNGMKPYLMETSYVFASVIHHTVPIDRILSVKNVQEWVSIDFT